MKYSVVFLAIASISVSAKIHYPVYTEEEVRSQFEQFKNDYSRVYQTATEEQLRMSIFHEHLEYIFRHNLEASHGLHRFTVGVNNFADLTNAEFRESMLRAMPFPNQVPITVHTNITVKSLPDTVDWVAKGVVTPVADQGQCGSSWAFPAVNAIEGQHAINTGKLVALSVQQLIDCCAQDGNYGCNGGFFDTGYKCVMRMGGIDTSASYPYNADYDEKCLFNPKTIGANIAGYVDIAHDEHALQNAVANVGPIAVAIDASQTSYQLYQSGVYNDPNCSSVNVNHGVTVVGYGTQDGAEYWKVKNSWGTSWGEEGYIQMSRNKNDQCGIANLASYPVV